MDAERPQFRENRTSGRASGHAPGDAPGDASSDESGATPGTAPEDEREHTRGAHEAHGAPGKTPGKTPRRLPIFATVGVALLMMSLDVTIVATALHALQRGLDTSINWAGWTLTAYSFGFVLMLPLSGKLGDRYGRKRVFLWSVLVFSLASFLCGIANNIYLLIVLRAIQAAGGAGFTPSATGIIVDHFGDERDRYVGLFGSIFPLGAMIGPIFGGLFVTYWNWRGIFFVNVPAGLIVLFCGLWLIPADRKARPAAHKNLGTDGMLLLGATILGFMLAASYLGGQHAELYSPLFLLPAGAAFLFLHFFLRRARLSPQPFIAARLIHGEGFGAVNAANAIFGGVTQGVIALVPLYAASRYQLGALVSGTLLIAEGMAALLVTSVMAFRLRYTGYRRPIAIGVAIMAFGMLLLALRPPGGMAPHWWLGFAAFIVGGGFGVINPATRNAGLQLAPDHAATLAALRSAGMQLGSIATISIATAIFASSGENSIALAWIFTGCAALILALSAPIVRHVPEHHGAW